MMQYTHRIQEERARPIYQRVFHPKGEHGRAPLQSRRFLESFCDCQLGRPPTRLAIWKGLIELFPPNTGFGAEPRVISAPPPSGAPFYNSSYGALIRLEFC